MRVLFIYLSVFISASLSAQDWQLLNRNYRYNYKFDNATDITNVMFVDSTNFPLNDSVYHLNRIAGVCVNNCYGQVFPSIGGARVVDNLPQFLQRSMKRYQNGDVVLYDTLKLLIKTTCSLNQSWLADTINAKNAVCVSVNTLMVFGVVDSVKKVLLNGTDTIKWSKNFGLLVFPKPYSVNKYYRLVGIENSLYEKVALFGEKLINAWDIYDFQIGDVICNTFKKSDLGWQNPNVQKHLCITSQSKILSKTLDPTGYTYSTTQTLSVMQSTALILSCGQNSYLQNGGLTFSNLFSPSLAENYMYPGMLNQGYFSTLDYGFDNYQPHLVSWSMSFPHANVVFVTTNSLGVKYKGVGKNCSGTDVPVGPFNGLARNVGGYYSIVNYIGGVFGEKIGYVSSGTGFFEHIESNCRPCAATFAPPNPIGLAESTEQEKFSYYYNTLSQELKFNSKGVSHIIITNSNGAIVITQPDESPSVNCSQLSPGLYFISCIKDGIPTFGKFLIQA